MIKSSYFTLFAAAVLAPVIPQSTWAQDASSSSVLEEIVVTAQRREENLQDIPIAASVLTGDELAGKAIQQLSDLEFAAPSLSITDQGLTQSVNIRGIGISSGSPQVTNGVAVYLDGVFEPQIVTTNIFYDIADVEVLRGPQGTLVGANSTGGAIFINTQSPQTDRIAGYADVGYGNYDSITAEAAINLPLSETFAVRVAGNFRKRDSYYQDSGVFNNKPDRQLEKAGRLGIRWEPGAFRAIAKIEGIDRDTGGYAYRPIQGTNFAAGRTNDLRILAYDSPTKNHERGILSSLELRYTLNSGIVLRSVSGYSNRRINNLYDLDATALLTQTEDQYVREREWSEEINIISPTDGRLNWILGGYYQRNKIDVDLEIHNDDFTSDPLDVLIFTDKTILGAFAQAGYLVLPTVELQAGLRYAGFDSEGSGSVILGRGNMFSAPPFFPGWPPDGLKIADLAGKHSDGRLIGKVAINWKFLKYHLLYAFIARGYKPGGFNSATSSFGPETAMDYEVGWKGSFFAEHLRTQFSLFYMSYNDFQFDTLDTSSGQPGVANVANATIKGLELQAQGRFGGLGIDGALAYVDSNLGSFSLVNLRLLPPGTNQPQCGPGQFPPACFDYVPFTQSAGGGPNLFSPKWSFNIGMDYEFAFSNGITLTPRLNYAYVGGRFTNLFYSPVTDYLTDRGLLSALLTLRYGDWHLEGYATNLTHEEYVSGQAAGNEFYGSPREYGFRVGVRY